MVLDLDDVSVPLSYWCSFGSELKCSKLTLWLDQVIKVHSLSWHYCFKQDLLFNFIIE